MSAAIVQPLKWHGGKNYLAKKIVEMMPPRCTNPNAPEDRDAGWLHYVEPFAGGLAVLLANDSEGISEVVNDKNKELSNFWSVLRSPTEFPLFQRLCEATPFSEEVFHASRMAEPALSPSEQAWRFFVRCRQSLAGRMKAFAAITKNRTRRGMNEQVSAWINAIDGLPAVHARLKRVLILNEDASEVIRKHDGPRTLFYLDPPYLHNTRASTDDYAFEMSESQHIELLNLLLALQAKVMLSGYASALYDRTLASWNRHIFDLPNNAAAGPEKRRMTEVLWCNF